MYKIWTHVRLHIMKDVAFNMKKSGSEKCKRWLCIKYFIFIQIEMP